MWVALKRAVLVAFLCLEKGRFFCGISHVLQVLLLKVIVRLKDTAAGCWLVEAIAAGC
jgi:hypothetical protein